MYETRLMKLVAVTHSTWHDDIYKVIEPSSIDHGNLVDMIVPGPVKGFESKLTQTLPTLGPRSA